ncbi:hypothetical protein GDO81_027770 [Engystomops pustulosus]|uniref:Uncharacterized protein n=1 Tax=Engystomops pustulosus TaxID=76066 RepID=A0AAV6YP47_ENGPU|nr:hypothetical protein GDO81_027770 [Engystomops pustulosus]
MRSPLSRLFSKLNNPKFCNLSVYSNPPIPLIILVALLCTRSSSIISFLYTGAQNCTQYSMCGLTRDLYKGKTMSLSWESIPLLIHPIILFALAAAAWLWSLKLSLPSTNTPKSFSASVLLSN